MTARSIDTVRTGLAGPTCREWPGAGVADPTPGPMMGSRPAGREGLSTIAEALAALRAGEMILVVDDHDRENEGDLIVAAEHADAAAINFMVTHGRGLVCLSLTEQRCDALDLPPMVPEVGDDAETAFTISIDFEEEGSTGISAADRARTVRHAVDPAARPRDFRRPGHVFPLRARPGGVLERPGHTEASVDLARLAGLTPAGVICEVMNPDGSMARLPELLDMADRYRLHLITIADLREYRRVNEALVEATGRAKLPTPHGDATALGFTDHEGEEHLAVVFGDPSTADEPLVRVHSECLTGDVFGSLRCDCGQQLDASMAAIADEGVGVVVYTRGHEGRGIGLVNKLLAYELQDSGHDTVEANLALGHRIDERDFLPAAQVLRALGLTRVRLLTNNPAKTHALASLGIDVTARVPLEIEPQAHSAAYLHAKRVKLGHHLTPFEQSA